MTGSLFLGTSVTGLCGSLSRWFAAFTARDAEAPDYATIAGWKAEERAMRRQASALAERPPLPIC